MQEAAFRKSLIVSFKEHGKEAFPIESSTSPGFPDMVVAGFTTSLVECKVVSTRASRTTLHDLFEATQRAFQKRWWTTQAGALWLALYVENDGTCQALQLSPDLLEKQVCQVTTYGITADSVAKLVARWKCVL